MGDRRLLILDDDPMTGETIQRIAEFAGLEVRFTPDPDRFFDLFREWRPTHIALDLVMPTMDGVQVMARLAKLSCRAKIIITSGVGSRVLDAAGRSAVEHGLDIAGVLPKPFSPGQLREMLRGQIASPPPPVAGTPAPPPELTPADLRQALDRHEFVLAYQPKVLCTTGEMAGVEALVRWAHPTYGLLPPWRFIPLAESCDLIDPLTDQVIEQALAWFGPLCTAGATPLSPALCEHLMLSVNISARTLGNGALFERVQERCQAHGVDPVRLIFELTETSAMDDPVASLDLLTRLRMIGFHLSIDDFGTGFSSMLQLVRLPFSEIKVDKSFVMTAMTSPESRTVVKFIVDLGHSLGLRCTAEGVEDAETLDYLTTIGCDLAQGYHIARPLAGDDFWPWLALRDRYALRES
ncbi:MULTISPECIES: EAL domain-containing response regulator [Cyanophyceae]|uniref:EAL domain-containing response regulator n=1 Tax=Cyanophyceae TaxID=3028117 RepID=UPI0016866F25|nr:MULTISPECIES: EAL domain-containing response regulator [Cyanophyceae]MBD1917394.1 EAL domain-containing response regulator [Phormidium sp. FACHB-77]MBD2032361.1 EAL domain-containing response regulator [Phormidium sp. FACHB-322]MBD2052299.1 EAL domain-containing response regulator [Leptolyngbya sp. FACHB-60]